MLGFVGHFVRRWCEMFGMLESQRQDGFLQNGSEVRRRSFGIERFQFRNRRADFARVQVRVSIRYDDKLRNHRVRVTLKAATVTATASVADKMQ